MGSGFRVRAEVGLVGFLAYPREFGNRFEKGLVSGYEKMMENLQDGTSLDWIYERLPPEALTVLHLRFLVPLTETERQTCGNFDYRCAVCNKNVMNPFEWTITGQTTLPLGDEQSSFPVGPSLLLSSNAAGLTYKGWEWWGIPGYVGGGN